MIQFRLPLFAATPVCVIPLRAIRRGSARRPRMPPPIADARLVVTLHGQLCPARRHPSRTATPASARHWHARPACRGSPSNWCGPAGAIYLRRSVSAHSDWNCCSFSPAPGWSSDLLCSACALLLYFVLLCIVLLLWSQGFLCSGLLSSVLLLVCWGLS
jgi:hypothetical protein